MIPWEFAGPIRTERLILRLPTESDLDDVHAWMSDPEVARYQLYEPRTREQVATHLAEVSAARVLAKDDDYLQLAIALPEVDRERVIGSIYLPIKSVADLTAEIGWALARAYQGQGYAFEAASAVLDLAFGDLGMHRVYAELDPRNGASVTLCERLGMRHEAHHVDHMMFKGAWADTGIYAILDWEWAALSAARTS